MDQVCDKSVCTGCFACKVVCPKSAIGVKLDDHGHRYPVINQNLCIECGRCSQVCPSNKDISPLFNPKPNFTWACWNKDENKRKESASGGIAYVLSKCMVEDGGYFVGCQMKSNKAIHTICNQKDDLFVYQGSKYVQSEIDTVYSQIKDLIRDGKKVLFIGTPCQVAAVKSFLGKQQDNFYSIDLICHGVPSAKFLQGWINDSEKRFNKKISNVRFRVKFPHHLRTAFEYCFEDGTSYKEILSQNKYYLSYVYKYTVRDSCRKCAYAQLHRVGDITLADFWGYRPKRMDFISYLKGTSMAFVNTQKGELMMDKIRPFIKIEKRSLEEGFEANKYNLSDPIPVPENYNQFWTLMKNKGSLDAISLDFFKPYPMPDLSIKDKIKDLCRILFPDMLINCLKKF